MMQFKEFEKQFIEKLESDLPNGYKTEIAVSKKTNNNCKGLVVIKDDSMVSPVINTEKLYAAYNNLYKTASEVYENIVTTTKKRNQSNYAMIPKDYNILKESLFIRVSSAEQNREFLSNHPHTIVGDLAITYHICIKSKNERILFPFSNSLLHSYGIDIETLHTDAITNAPKLFPVRYDDTFNRMTVITNQEKTNGAACVFYPGMLEELAKSKGNYYLLPSSIHEFIIIEEKLFHNTDELINMVKTINSDHNIISPEDILTNSVYHYDACKHIFKTYNKKKRFAATFI